MYVSLEPAVLSGTSDEIRFWTTLHNPWGPECSPAFVDTPVSDGTPDPLLSPRPTTVVSLEIRDERGRLIQPRSPGGDRHAALRAHQLVLLQCGHGYSWEVRPARVPWGYDLAPGRYVARVTVVVPVASFVKWHLSVEADVMALAGYGADAAKGYLRDVAPPPVELAFVVTR